MQHPTFVVMSYAKREALPEPLRPYQHIRYCETFVRWVLERFTREGDVVLDPFAGFGTTLIVAEEMNRIAYGVELVPDRCEFIRSKLTHGDRLLQGDSRRLGELSIPQVDLVLTGPPYGVKDNQKNPVSAYCEAGDYSRYMADLKSVFAAALQKLKPNGRLLIECSNLRDKRGAVTPLAWDICRELSSIATFHGETVFCWQDGYLPCYDHSYLMEFSPAAA